MKIYNAYYLIESAPLVAVVKSYIADLKRVRAENAEICSELGDVKTGWTDRNSGAVYAVKFEGKHHSDFTKPGKDGFSRPKKGTEWAKRFAEHKGITRTDMNVISDQFNVPFNLQYTTKDGYGSTAIGYFQKPAGFIFPSEDGPFGLYIPDVAHYVARHEADGLVVDADVKCFDMNLKGCRRILSEEWDLICARVKLEQQQKAEG